MDDGLSMVGLAVMRLWVMAKVKLFDAGGIRIGYMLGSASMLISAWCDTINYSIVGQVIQKSSLLQAMWVLAAESASQSDADTEMSASSLNINAKSFPLACLAVSLLGLYHANA